MATFPIQYHPTQRALVWSLCSELPRFGGNDGGAWNQSRVLRSFAKRTHTTIYCWVQDYATRVCRVIETTQLDGGS